MATPEWIGLAQVVGKVQELYALKISRTTPHNWAKVGVKGRQLRTKPIGGRLYTTQEWLDDFLSDTGL